MSELSENTSITSANSDLYQISDDSNMSIDASEMKAEEMRLKQKHSKEQRALERKLKEEKISKEKKEKAIKSMNYLLDNSQKYSRFFLDRFKDYSIEKEKNQSNKKKSQQDDIEYKQKIDELEKKLDSNVSESNIVKKSKAKIKPLKYFTGGTLQPHQKDGLVWLKLLFENGVNGILADEMGLGKTVQVIALISLLMEKRIPGPYLIVAPLSTIPNWMSEFARFAPLIPVVLFHGNQDERIAKYKDVQKMYELGGNTTAPVVVTSYQVPMSETRFLAKFNWQYIIIDEGHRIKNHECRLMRDLKSLTSLNRLLLTGTPLQNNLVELWALLNFLLPQFFRDADTFASLLAANDLQEAGKVLEQEQSTNIISTIHGVLAPFMLRRLKTDVLKDLPPKKEVLVYCPLSKMQKDLYQYILQKNIDKLVGKEEEKEVDITEGRRKRKCTLDRTYKGLKYTLPESDDEFDEDSAEFSQKLDTYKLQKKDKKGFIAQIKMQNSVMMFKRVVNHPYLIHFPLKPGTDNELLIDENIVENSGKMKILDAMLTRLKAGGHKVLIFSTLKIALDLIEDYLIIRNFGYCRLDGSHSLQNRQESIRSFNEDPDKFIFIISTRAGGLGINLTAADTVILYDRDWNPQVDLQAQDRCHRIGQKKPVMVYTLVTKGTIEEKILVRSTQKRRLEKVVISKGKFKNVDQMTSNLVDLKELESLLHSVDHSMTVYSNGYVLSNKQLNKLLDRSELYSEMDKDKKTKLNKEE